MTVSPRAGIVLFVLVQGLAGCGGPSTAPSPLSPVVTGPNGVGTFSNVTISGVVFEETLNIRTPIEHVDVYCEPCGAETHTWASTDSKGFYSFTGVWNPGFPTRLWIGKEGYTDPEGLPKITSGNPSGPGWREVEVKGHTRFDVQLVRR
jgi:hypothetical protein